MAFFPETKGTAYFHLPLVYADSLVSGKTLEEMNAVFGDEVDSHQILEKHGHDKSVMEDHGSEEKA